MESIMVSQEPITAKEKRNHDDRFLQQVGISVGKLIIMRFKVSCFQEKETSNKMQLLLATYSNFRQWERKQSHLEKAIWETVLKKQARIQLKGESQVYRRFG